MSILIFQGEPPPTPPQFLTYRKGSPKKKINTKKIKVKRAHPDKNVDYGETKKRKTYTCEDFSATFTQKYNLDRHIRSVHTKDFPYPCEDCDLAFITKDRLEHHT